MSGLNPDSTPEETEAWINRVANESAETVGQLVHFAKGLRKLKLGSQGGRVTLTTEECKALIWGIQMLRERDE